MTKQKDRGDYRNKGNCLWRDDAPIVILILFVHFLHLLLLLSCSPILSLSPSLRENTLIIFIMVFNKIWGEGKIILVEFPAKMNSNDRYLRFISDFLTVRITYFCCQSVENSFWVPNLLSLKRDILTFGEQLPLFWERQHSL